MTRALEHVLPPKFSVKQPFINKTPATAKLCDTASEFSSPKEGYDRFFRLAFAST